MESNLDKVLGRLRGVKKAGDEWLALCPAHDDQHPSLGVTEKDGKVLLHCLAGCNAVDVLAAIDLTFTDLYERREETTRTTTKTLVSKERFEYWFSDVRMFGTKVRYNYSDAPKDFRWEPAGLKSTDAPLYGEQHLKPRGRELIIVEGEKKRDDLAKIWNDTLGTGTGSSTIPSDEILKRYLDYEVIFLWPDNDDTGRNHMRLIQDHLISLGHQAVFVLNWAGAPPKGDAADFMKSFRD